MQQSGQTSSGAVPGLDLRTSADTAQLSEIRRRVRSYVAGAGGGDDIADDLELVVSELATNVIEHTSSPTLTIRVEKTLDAWILDVADVDDLSILDHVELPDRSEVTGRGLFVVASLVDDVRIVDDGGRNAVRCSRLVARVP
ncbi:MAG: ATP-binding protein [Ilumatobacteraceae bacterium]